MSIDDWLIPLHTHRYLVALKRACPPEVKPGETTSKKKVQSSNVWGEGRVGRGTGADRTTLGLARVGSRAALNFAFAFLRRAWRSGEDSDLCTELLQASSINLIHYIYLYQFLLQGLFFHFMHFLFNYHYLWPLHPFPLLFEELFSPDFKIDNFDYPLRFQETKINFTIHP